MRLLSAAETRALDAATIAAGTPGRVLMDRAGAGAARVALAMLGRQRGPTVVVCGRGNNGGDGFVVARRLRARGRRVEVWLLGAADEVRGDAAAMLRAWRRGGGRLRLIREGPDVEALAAACLRAALVVDALFGTGLNAPVAGLAAAVVGTINAAGRPVLALDIPSGLSADTGQPLGAAVRAVMTVTFGIAKVGLYLGEGPDHAGAVTLVDIGLVELGQAGGEPKVELLEARDLAASLSPRPRTAHKGTFGHVLVIGGSRGKLGAGLLAAEGAARTGAGLTTLAVPAGVQSAAEGRIAELMTVALPDDGTGMLAPGPLRLDLGRYAAVVCGPGLGLGEGPATLVADLVRSALVPLVLDADALTLIAGTSVLGARVGPTVVTPHPGEMARLTARPVADVQGDRLGSARRFAAESGAIVVLKGAGTVVAAPDGRAAICPTGNPGLASGGSGDVLAGVTGALLGQGLPPFDAAATAVFLHGRTADVVAAHRGQVGMLARDLLAELPATIAALQREAHGHP